MGFNLSGGYAAGEGASALESLWQLLAQKADMEGRRHQEGQRIKIAQQNADDNTAIRKQQQESIDEARAATAKLQAQQGADKLSGALAPGSVLDKGGADALRAGDLGSLIEHQDSALPSTALSGIADAGPKGPSIRGRLIETPNAGHGEQDVYKGTGQQQETDRKLKLRGRIMADPNTPDPVRQFIQMEDAGSKPIAELFKPEKPTTQPLIRVGRDGQPHNMGEIPAGAHVINEPAPSGASHGRFSMAQGSDSNGKPVMIRTNVDTGDVTVLPMPEGTNFAKREQPATQDQTNLGLYANRVEQSDPILTKLSPTITGMNPAIFAGQQFLDQPFLQSPDLQSYQQAARNFINAVLRRESGAAISPSEFQNARAQYLPVPGDSPQVLQQKAENRQVVFTNFKRGAGPAYRAIGGDKPAAGAGSGFKVVEIK